MVFKALHKRGIQLSEQGVRTIGELYRQEEVEAERNINRIALLFCVFFLAFSLLLPFITRAGWKDPNVLSDIIGVTIVLVYILVINILLRRGLYRPVIKYITITIIASIITLVVWGYSIGVDFVHSTRSVTVTTYFLVIFLSGLYQNPRLPIFASIVICLEYGMLFLLSIMSGDKVYFRMETFRENILTWDILVVYLAVFAGSGLMMHFNTLRHRILALMLQESSEKLFHEAEERRHSEEKARFFENYDILTRLPNITHFRERLDGEIVKAESRKQIFAVMCLGLDAFKNVNQLYGTETGHAALREVGSRLRGAFREDDIVSRFRGDNFLVLFSDLHSDYNISDLIKKTRQVFADDFSVDESRIKLTAGAGISTYPNDGRTVDTLIGNAETAMYEAKSTGKDVFRLYDRKMQEDLDIRIHIERDLQDAIVNGEFRLAYQPKVDLGGNLRGMEALLRWESAARGPVPPDVFIPIAERSGLIVEIGYHVIELCCRQIEEWTWKGMEPTRIMVNVSPYQFGHADFIPRMMGIVRQYGIGPGWLGVEITESGIMENESECIVKMNALRGSDMTISIDDFGKGYSSLTRLGNYPVDTLKIDKSFVDGLPSSSASACIIKSIIDLAHNLGCAVVAEGVESREQVAFLAESGCDLFQGFFFHQPLQAEEAEKILIGEVPKNLAGT